MPDVVLAGVGGQGCILTGRILAETALAIGHDVKTSEVHGMAQRGGSVVCMVRWAAEVHSPLIPTAAADFILAFELLEGLRFAPYISRQGTAIVNNYRLDPLPVLRGDETYPEDALDRIREVVHRLQVVEARELAIEAGNARSTGSVLLGALSYFLDFPVEAWENSILRFVPGKAQDVNLKAFALGRKACSPQNGPL
jgi:indolepyruvate ferredoxin oxidoreductase, beta subunit